MATYQRYVGRFAYTSVANGLTIGASSFTFTSGYYYLHGYSGESSVQFCEHMQTVIRAAGGAYAAVTVTLSLSTGKITITGWTGGAKSFVWGDTTLQTLLGFSGSQTGASSYTATYPSPTVWYPSLPATYYPVDLTGFWNPESTTRVMRSRDGTSYAVIGNVVYSSRVNYQLLPDTDMIKTSSRIGGTLQHMFENVFHQGAPVRIYPDRDLNSTTANFVTGVYGSPDDDMIGGFSGAIANRRIESYNGLWDCELQFMKHV